MGVNLTCRCSGCQACPVGVDYRTLGGGVQADGAVCIADQQRLCGLLEHCARHRLQVRRRKPRSARHCLEWNERVGVRGTRTMSPA